MYDTQITDEVLRYLNDSFYNYAVLIDGEWGCGKTYYIKNVLIGAIEEAEKGKEQARTIKYISLYGCKSVDDIQENIVWELVGEVSGRIGQSIPKTQAAKIAGTTGKRILGALLKRFDSEGKAIDMVTELINLRSCIFIFDDLERCDCPLNEVFGYINGLVEHEGTKVIIVANEHEIDTKVKEQQLELQYLLAANKDIVWPQKEDKYERRINNGSGLDIQELERRRKLLFTEEELDDSYGKIREKLIGVTLHYQPDAANIIGALIDKIELPELLKDTIIENRNFIINQMERYGHHNLRTFLFFVSKMAYLYEKIDDLRIEEEYLSQIVADVVGDCFIVCVEFKGNIKPPTDRWERICYDARKKLVSVHKYVRYGDFDSELFHSEINHWLDELKCNLLPNDPYLLLRQEYWLRPQKWVEEKVEECLQRMQQGKYESPVFGRMIVTFCELQQIGFPHDYVQRLQQGILERVDYLPSAYRVDVELYFIDDTELKEMVKIVVRDINAVLNQRSEATKQQTVEEILQSEDWVKALTDYVYSQDYKNSHDRTLFSKATSDQWLDAIRRTDPNNLMLFRQLFMEVYPKNVLLEESKPDMPMLKEIAEGIQPDEADDLIVKFDLELLRKDLLNASGTFLLQ